MFKWKTTQGGYIVPGKTLHEDVLKETLVLNDTSDGGFWTWTAEGQVRWSQGVIRTKRTEVLQHCFRMQKVCDQPEGKPATCPHVLQTIS